MSVFHCLWTAAVAQSRGWHSRKLSFMEYSPLLLNCELPAQRWRSSANLYYCEASQELSTASAQHGNSQKWILSDFAWTHRAEMANVPFPGWCWQSWSSMSTALAILRAVALLRAPHSASCPSWTRVCLWGRRWAPKQSPPAIAGSPPAYLGRLLSEKCALNYAKPLFVSKLSFQIFARKPKELQKKPLSRELFLCLLVLGEFIWEKPCHFSGRFKQI